MLIKFKKWFAGRREKKLGIVKSKSKALWLSMLR
jgi:hypothetical protein